MSVFNYLSPKDADWGDAVAEFKRHRIDRFILYPSRWKEYPVGGTKLAWQRTRFTAAGVKALPDNTPGLYSFIAEPDIAGHDSVRYLLYIGETHRQSLRARVSSYLKERTKPKPRIHIVEMLERFPDHLWLYYAAVKNATTVEKIESDLLAAFLPPFNREFPAIVADLVRAVFS